MGEIEIKIRSICRWTRLVRVCPPVADERSRAVNVADNPGLAQAIDFRDECDALYAALATAPAEAWERPTQFKGWTFNDVLGHLHMFDHAAELAARGRAEIKSFLGEVAAGCADGTSLTDFTRRWLHGCNGAELLDRWRTQYRHLADVYLPLEPNLRLAWAGPDMSARSFMSARQMETWAHGQAVYDLIGPRAGRARPASATSR
jgi:uncharacterized protein (TIGR03084 family)